MAVGPDLTCFDWQNRSSEYLDNSLDKDLQERADDHLSGCQTCSTRLEHYRTLISTLAAQPKRQVPAGIRKSPLSFVLPKNAAGLRETLWERAPWYVRTTLEGLGVAFTVVFVVAMIPKARLLYERSLERSLDPFNLVDLVDSGKEKTEGGESLPQLARGRLTSAADESSEAEATEEHADDFSSEGEEEVGAGDDVRVGNSEIWRFNIKTDSPHDVQPKIVQILIAAHVPKDSPGLGGIEAPGGIQFDVFVPKNSVGTIKAQLQRLAAPNQTQTALGEAPVPGNFTWYKNKSKRKVPDGRARVVIWLSQV